MEGLFECITDSHPVNYHRYPIPIILLGTNDIYLRRGRRE